MKIILLQDIRSIGKKFEVKDVSGGYARNFLFPNGLAESATPGALKKLAERKIRNGKRELRATGTPHRCRAAHRGGHA